MRLSIVVAGAVLSFVVAKDLPADPPVRLEPGARVRLTGQKLKGLDPSDLFATEVLGTLEGWDEESIHVRIRDPERVVRSKRAAIDVLDVSVRPKRLGCRTAKGAVVGTLVGASLGAIAGSSGTSGTSGLCFDRGELVAIGAIEGLLIGSIVGVIRGTERWKAVPLPDGAASGAAPRRVGWSFGPVPGRGVGFSVRVGFGDYFTARSRMVVASGPKYLTTSRAKPMDWRLSAR